MKNLIIVGGTMGIGKTTVCRQLQKQLKNCVFLDGDWCWDMDPFVVNDETKKMVLENIVFLLTQFIRCQAYENIIFCWVMHKQEIIDEILSCLPVKDLSIHVISLLADEKSLIARLKGDIDSGIRTDDITQRSLAYLPLYRQLDTVKIETGGQSVAQICKAIIKLIS